LKWPQLQRFRIEDAVKKRDRPYHRIEASPKTVEVRSGKTKAYITKGELVAPSLHPNKLEQRKELVKDVKGGTVVEMFAGEGNLTKQVYADKMKADKIVAVDVDSRALKKVEEKVKDKTEIETYPSHNVKWAEQQLPYQDLRDVKVVDFDAFGSPADAVQAFFDNYEVKRPMRVGLTDGSGLYIAQLGVADDEAKRREWIRKEFGVSYSGQWNREKQKQILDNFMERQGREHGFKVQKVNEAHGDQWAIYKGYKIIPAVA